MVDIQLVIDDFCVPVEFVWVHLQPVLAEDSHSYAIIVPMELAREIFGEIPIDSSIESAIYDLIADLGTYVVDGYLNNIRKWQNAKYVPFRWVIATVNAVTMENDRIVIRGDAIPFVRDTND